MSAVAGVDTWSPAWYVDPDGPAAADLNRVASYGAGRGKLLPERVLGHRIGWFPQQGMLYAEGHPAAALGLDGLGDPSQLEPALFELEEAMRDTGLPLPDFGGVGRRVRYPGDGLSIFSDRAEGFAGFRRLDSTVNLPTRGRSEGIAVLAGIAAVVRDMPGAKLRPFFAVDGTRLETVELRGRSGVRILGRAYDKGVESGLAGPGELVRLEDQRRFVKESRREVGELTRGYVHGKIKDRFMPLWKATKGVTVAGPLVLAEKVQRLIDEEEITYRKGEQLAGHLLLTMVRGGGMSRATRYRRRNDLLDHGLALADGVLDEVEVNVHDVLEEALEAPVWGSQG